MTQSLHRAASAGFSQAASLYQQVRPDYPIALHAWLQQLQLPKDAQLMDLGAGTGKFLPHLLPLSTHIVAVEPVANMLAELQQRYPQVHSIQRQIENLDLPAQSFDAIFCAQSFHWFANAQAIKQISQLLKPNAHLVLIWNQRDINVDWVQALAKLIEPLEQDTPRFHHMHWLDALQQQNTLVLEKLQLFQHQQHGTVEDIVAKRLLSTSFIAALSADQQQQLKAQFEAVVFAYTGKHPHDAIDFPYTTYVYHFIKR